MVKFVHKGKLVHDFQCRDVAEMHFDVLKKQVGDRRRMRRGFSRESQRGVA